MLSLPGTGTPAPDLRGSDPCGQKLFFLRWKRSVLCGCVMRSWDSNASPRCCSVQSLVKGASAVWQRLGGLGVRVLLLSCPGAPCFSLTLPVVVRVAGPGSAWWELTDGCRYLGSGLGLPRGGEGAQCYLWAMQPVWGRGRAVTEQGRCSDAQVSRFRSDLGP